MITFPHTSSIASFAGKGNADQNRSAVLSEDHDGSSRLELHETQLGPIVLIFASYGRVSDSRVLDKLPRMSNCATMSHHNLVVFCHFSPSENLVVSSTVD
jgi:hypothetical protein